MASNAKVNGRFRFDISYRRMRGDEGLSLKVLGPVANETKELLRFDCFLNSPHYHVEVYGKNAITKIDEENPAEWAFDTLQSDFEKLINSSGADALNATEREALNETLEGVVEQSRNLISSETGG